jgi:FkbM family methyltransferase
MTLVLIMSSNFKRFLKPVVNVGISIFESTSGFHTDKSGFIPNRLRMLLGTYEVQVCRKMQTMLPPGGVFVDVGANVGYISKYIANNCKPSQIIAIEPNPRLREVLQKNLKKYTNISILHAALSDIEGFTEMYVGKDSAVGSLTPGYTKKHHNHDPVWIDSIRSVRIATLTGDAVFANLASIDLLKIDVEGHEVFALRGMRNSMQTRKIKKILFEFSPFAQHCAGFDPCDLLNLFWDNNFKIYLVEGVESGREVTPPMADVLVKSLAERGYTSLVAEIEPRP